MLPKFLRKLWTTLTAAPSPIPTVAVPLTVDKIPTAALQSLCQYLTADEVLAMRLVCRRWNLFVVDNGERLPQFRVRGVTVGRFGVYVWTPDNAPDVGRDSPLEVKDDAMIPTASRLCRFLSWTELAAGNRGDTPALVALTRHVALCFVVFKWHRNVPASLSPTFACRALNARAIAERKRTQAWLEAEVNRIAIGDTETTTFCVPMQCPASLTGSFCSETL